MFMSWLIFVIASKHMHTERWKRKKETERERFYFKLVGVITIRFPLFTLTIESRSLYMSNIWANCWHVIFHSSFFGLFVLIYVWNTMYPHQSVFFSRVAIWFLNEFVKFTLFPFSFIRWLSWFKFILRWTWQTTEKQTIISLLSDRFDKV